MIHDTIPLDFPNMVPAGSVTTHARVMQLTARYARLVLAPTQAAGRSITEALALHGTRDIAVRAVPLPIDRTFHQGVSADPALAAHPYFVVCGAIEVRKNQALLLRIWDSLVARLGERAPRLIIAGRPGFGAAEILDRVRRSDRLARHVFISSGLSTPALAVLMAGARALLMPSFAEGFGLPPVEAMAVGTPAILSDIAAHREAAGDFGIFVDPTDEAGWERRIEAMSTDTPDYLAAKARMTGFKPLTWADFMAGIERILLELD